MSFRFSDVDQRISESLLSSLVVSASALFFLCFGAVLCRLSLVLSLLRTSNVRSSLAPCRKTNHFARAAIRMKGYDGLVFLQRLLLSPSPIL